MEEPYKSEIKGIAKYIKSDVYNVTLYNLVYEFSAFCTSIIVQDTQGNIFHGRNVDFPIPPFRDIVC